MKVYVILAIAGIALLYFLSGALSPPHVSIGNLWKYEGKEVIIEGKVVNKFGNIFEIKNSGYKVSVYIWKGNYSFGDVLKIRGVVDEKEGEPVIYANDVKIKERWNEKTISLPYLAENIEDYIGCKIRVSGYIYSISSDYFYLTDEKGEYRARVYYENFNGTLYKNVIVDGLLKFNSRKMEFYIEGINVG